MRIGLYARVSTREQAEDGDALVRQIWQLNRAAQQYGGQTTQFTDIQSGRRDDRPQFQLLLDRIKSKELDLVIITRVDRFSRDLAMQASLAKLFEKTGVKIHEILLGRIVDWKNPNDWDYFVRSGVKAEGESRMLAARISQTFDWLREQNKPAGGHVGWPYRRSQDGFIEPNPEAWPIAVQAILICLDCGGATTKALIRIREELGVDRSRQWLHHWLRSPLLRGHLVRDTLDSRGYRKSKGDRPTMGIAYNTHPSIFSDPLLIAARAEERLDLLLSHAKRTPRGKTLDGVDPLSGLCICDRCGGPANIKNISHWRYPEKRYRYVVCGARHGRGKNCGGDYGNFRGQRRTIHTVYDLAESAVIEALAARGNELIRQELAAIAPPQQQETPEMRGLAEQIKRLEALADPDLDGAIAKKKAQLSQLAAQLSWKGDNDSEELKAIAIDRVELDMLTREQRRSLYLKHIREVRCDRDKVRVYLRGEAEPADAGSLTNLPTPDLNLAPTDSTAPGAVD